MAKEKCERCEKRAVVSLPCGPHRFCKEHFVGFFERRVRKTCKGNKLVGRGEKIVVAYSGGKDSAVTLFLVNKLFGKGNAVEALLIDEGISGYRDRALGFAERNCRKWGIAFKRVSFEEEFGFTMVDVMKKTGAKKKIGGTCSFCGVLRRKLMNQYAKEMNAGKLATGHNLDDEAQSILMNVCDSDLKRFTRLGPIVKSANSKGFVPRIKPLWETPETEVIQFAKFNGIKFYEEQCCPFKWQAKRNNFRAVLNHLEAVSPGTMHSVLGFFKKAGPKLVEKSKTKLRSCGKCGEPCNGEECMACALIKRL